MIKLAGGIFAAILIATSLTTVLIRGTKLYNFLGKCFDMDNMWACTPMIFTIGVSIAFFSLTYEKVQNIGRIELWLIEFAFIVLLLVNGWMGVRNNTIQIANERYVKREKEENHN